MVLWPQYVDDFVEIAPDQIRNVAEHRGSEWIQFAYSKVRIDQIHTQRRLIEQCFKLGRAAAQRLFGLESHMRKFQQRPDPSHQLTCRERFGQVVVGTRIEAFYSRLL